jgi:hypothetical protein
LTAINGLIKKLQKKLSQIEQKYQWKKFVPAERDEKGGNSFDETLSELTLQLENASPLLVTTAKCCSGNYISC